MNFTKHLLLIVTAVTCLLPVLYCAPESVFCYFSIWKDFDDEILKDFDANLCTHVVGAFYSRWVLFDDAPPGEKEKIDKMQLPAYLSLKRKNPNLKLMISIGSEDGFRYEFVGLANGEKRVTRFVENVIAVLRETKYDGLDLQWDYTNDDTADAIWFSNLLTSLRKAFDQYGYVLTISVPPAEAVNSVKAGYELPVINQTVDFIHLVTYTKDYDSSTAEHVFPLYKRKLDTRTTTIDDSVRLWLSKGFPASKIIFSIPMFGHTWTLKDAANFAPPAPATGVGKWNYLPGYGNICRLLRDRNWQLTHDSNGEAYALSGDEIVAFNDIQAIKAKAAYIVSRGLGGVALVYFTMDDYDDACGDGKFPLLMAIHDTLNGVGKIGEKDKQPVTCPEPCGHFKDPQSCSKFYRCIENFPLSAACPIGLYFNPNTSICDWPSNVDCDNFSCPGECGRFAHPDTCSSFYICAKGSAKKINCPTGLYFNPKILTCDHPKNVPSCASND